MYGNVPSQIPLPLDPAVPVVPVKPILKKDTVYKVCILNTVIKKVYILCLLIINIVITDHFLCICCGHGFMILFFLILTSIVILASQ